MHTELSVFHLSIFKTGKNYNYDKLIRLNQKRLANCNRIKKEIRFNKNHVSAGTKFLCKIPCQDLQCLYISEPCLKDLVSHYLFTTQSLTKKMFAGKPLKWEINFGSLTHKGTNMRTYFTYFKENVFFPIILFSLISSFFYVIKFSDVIVTHAYNVLCKVWSCRAISPMYFC